MINLAPFDIVVVTPFYEDKQAACCLLKDLVSLFAHKVFIVIVDDGSLNDSLHIQDLQESAIHGVIIKLRLNLGHQRAIAIGLSYIENHITPAQKVIIMDADGEDVPHKIIDLCLPLKSENIDIVVAQRKKRSESIIFKLFYSLYKQFFAIMTGKVIDFGNFMALKVSAVKRLVAMRELPIHLAGSVLASKLRLYFCPLDRGHRYFGKSKMNFIALVLHGFKALMVFAEDVLVRVGIACAVVAFFSLFSMFSAIFLKILGYSTPGWFSVTLGILILMFMQTGSLALISLLLMGVVRSRFSTDSLEYKRFIAEVLYLPQSHSVTSSPTTHSPASLELE
jgi:glycosyltransferase involved in cell wall biosynthesis